MMEWAVTSSALLLAVMLLRAVFRKRIGPKLQYAIWAVVLLRLLLPFSLFQSPVSVMSAFSTPPAVENPANRQPAVQRPGEEATFPTGQNAGDSDASAPDPAAPAKGNSAGLQPSNPPDAKALLGALWAVGAALTGIWFLGTNLLFAFRLKQTRRDLPVSASALPVYLTAAAASPCLFGVFRPAIYLTPKAAETPESQKHVIAHELCHRRQGDHIWSLLRGLCVALWWWNPLVWAAAALSRTDSELACDEAAIRYLGEDSRLDYGRTLVGMIAVKGAPSGLLCAATTMSAGKRGIKERITMIVKRPKRFLSAAIAAALLAGLFAGCAFAGPEPAISPQAGGTLVLSVACDQPVYEIAWDAGGASGGTMNADNSPFVKGDLVTLDFSGPMDYTLKALDQNGVPFAEGAFSDVFEGGARIELTLTADLQFVRPEQPAADPTYAIIHVGENGEMRAVVPLPGSCGAELAKDIIMDYMLKSAAWPGIDFSAFADFSITSQPYTTALPEGDFSAAGLPEGDASVPSGYVVSQSFTVAWPGGVVIPTLSDYYVIRQSFPGETHDYYAYIVTGGEANGAVLQGGANGFYSRISDELYQSLAEYMQGIEPTPAEDKTHERLNKKQAERLAAHLLEFAEYPRGEDLRGFEYSGDWDGDGQADRAYMNDQNPPHGYRNQVRVELGNGERIVADSIELESMGYWGGSGFLIESGDLTGDGQNEILLMIDLGGQGGRGSYGLYPFTRTENGWALMDAPRHGFSLALDYKDGKAAVTSGAYSETVADDEMLRAHYAADHSESEWDRVKGREYHAENAADPICDIALVQENGKTLVKLSQYVVGVTGVHVDGLGYLVTTLSWNAEGAFSVEDMRFVLWPQ